MYIHLEDAYLHVLKGREEARALLQPLWAPTYPGIEDEDTDEPHFTWLQHWRVRNPAADQCPCVVCRGGEGTSGRQHHG